MTGIERRSVQPLRRRAEDPAGRRPNGIGLAPGGDADTPITVADGLVKGVVGTGCDMMGLGETCGVVTSIRLHPSNGNIKEI